MKHLNRTSIAFAISTLSVFGWLMIASAHVSASESSGTLAHDYEDASSAHRQYIKRFKGVAVTGVNSVRSKPFFSWGEPFGAFNFPTAFVFNEGGSEPYPIDESTPDSAILATGVSLDWLNLSGFPPDVIKSEWVNVPLRNVPVNVDFAYVQKSALPAVLEADRLELAQSEPASPITLGQWLAANGNATIDCAGDTATVKLRLRNLIPNRMYSVWANMMVPPTGDGSAPNVFPIPLGGAPNIFVTDRSGHAKYEREIGFCPMDQQAEESSLLFIDIYYHANHENYGAVITPGYIAGNWPGLITFSHIQFPINVDLLNDQ